KGKTDKTEIVNQDGKMIYHFMKPLYVEESCLVCHYDQGYKVGEVRGGISVELPFAMTLQAIRKNNVIMIALLGVLITIFTATLYIFIWKVMDTLEKQRIQLENLNQMKNKFLGICAHDLRNPLSSIMGYSELILDDNQVTLSEDHTMCIGRIHSSALRMLEMVNTLLDVSVIESGHLELHLSKGAVKPLLEEHIQISRLLADKKNITIHSSLHDTPDISFDKDRISQVFDNIISNAIKYSPQGSSIYVSLDSTNGYVRVSVRDEGPGISREEQGKLFHEFQRLSSKPTGGEKSTGLGLAIVKKIIDYHKGKIEVESQPGKGSTFIIKSLSVNNACFSESDDGSCHMK
ncbi:MAG: ATP-binding protein, partial [Pelolinea sp.]|nr:ATP-binding protein [Pelolinea sp.]